MTATTSGRVTRDRRQDGTARTLLAVLFLLPALVLLALLVVYPICYTVLRSLFAADGTTFVGIENYVRMFTDGETFTAIRNNVVWVLIAPTVVTALGLGFAVLTERVKWSTFVKLVVFMPMAISFLASSVIFRLVYDEDPDKGVANAIVVSVHDIFSHESRFPGARPRDATVLVDDHGALVTKHQVGPGGDPVQLGLVGFPPAELPSEAEQAAEPQASEGVSGVVWLDFKLGGGGSDNEIDDGERGMPGIDVEAVREGTVVATATTQNDGSFHFPDLADGSYTIRLPASAFAEPFRGLSWLGPSLVTPSIIAAYVWIYAGFAMVLIGAGLSALPRDVMEAARVDGASEWQVFRRITVPLLAPVLSVVLITLVINVLKIFDLVYIIAPGSVQPEANVLALQMWLVSFGGGQDLGLGSAISVLLLLLVVPAMVLNVRRFRRESGR